MDMRHVQSVPCLLQYTLKIGNSSPQHVGQEDGLVNGWLNYRKKYFRKNGRYIFY